MIDLLPSVRPRGKRANPLPEILPWHKWAAGLIRTVAYHGQPEPIDKKTGRGMLERDLKWCRFKLEVQRESRERIEMALRGAHLVWPTLGERPWSPAKAFSLKGPWVLLYERSITASGKARTYRPDTPKPFRDIFKAIAQSMP